MPCHLLSATTPRGGQAMGIAREHPDDFKTTLWMLRAYRPFAECQQFLSEESNRRTRLPRKIRSTIVKTSNDIGPWMLSRILLLTINVPYGRCESGQNLRTAKFRTLSSGSEGCKRRAKSSWDTIHQKKNNLFKERIKSDETDHLPNPESLSSKCTSRTSIRSPAPQTEILSNLKRAAN
ncbi:hypothetical protein BJX62DRAFT_113279 [Aspergillus germanicus]